MILNTSCAHLPSFPVDGIRSTIRKSPHFLLGVVGLLTTKNRDAIWLELPNALSDQLHVQWNIPVAIVRPDSDTSLSPASRSAKDRFAHLSQLTVWRQNRLAIVDLGMANHSFVTTFARHCDGVVLLVDRIDSATKQFVSSHTNDNVPWLGYWMVCPTTTQSLSKHEAA